MALQSKQWQQIEKIATTGKKSRDWKKIWRAIQTRDDQSLISLHDLDPKNAQVSGVVQKLVLPVLYGAIRMRHSDSWPPTISPFESQRTTLKSTFPRDRLERLAAEFEFLSDHAATEEVVARHHDQVLKLANGQKEYFYDLQFALNTGEGRKNRKLVLGVEDLDATIMTLNGDWFNIYDNSKQSFIDGTKNADKVDTCIVCRGTDADDLEHICKMWQMFGHAKIGCVVSVLGASDRTRASWSCLDSDHMQYVHKHAKVSVWVESEDAAQILPRSVLDLYKACVGKSKSRASGRLFVTVRKLRYKIDNSPSKTLVHVMVDNWTDMVGALTVEEVQFLANLALLIDGISDHRNTFEHPWTHRQVFHCSAGCGRSDTVMVATWLVRPDVGPLNSNLFDVVGMLKSQRYRAINCIEHYASLDLLLIRQNERPALVAATCLADNLSQNAQYREDILWCIMIALRETLSMCDNLLWYKYLTLAHV